MKKVPFTLTVVLIIMIMHTQAQNNSPFVKWDPPADITEEKSTAYLKQAMVKGKIPNAEIIADADDYKAIWGENGYNYILNAPPEKFHYYYADGEQNNGINQDGQVAAGNILQAKDSVLVIGVELENGEIVSIAKFGDNGCFNALGKIHQAPPKPTPQPRKTTPAATTTTTDIAGTQCCPTQSTWESDYAKYDLGRKDEELALYRHTNFLKANGIGGLGESNASYSEERVIRKTVYKEDVEENQSGERRGRGWEIFDRLLYAANTAANVKLAFFPPKQRQIVEYRNSGGGRRYDRPNNNGGSHSGPRVYNNTDFDPERTTTTTKPPRRYNESQLNGQFRSKSSVRQNSGYNNQSLGTRSRRRS